MELFKTTKKYDGDLGREMHEFPSSAELPVWRWQNLNQSPNNQLSMPAWTCSRSR